MAGKAVYIMAKTKIETIIYPNAGTGCFLRIPTLSNLILPLIGSKDKNYKQNRSRHKE